MASIYTYNILSPLAASGADVSLVNSNFKITGAPFINNKQTISGLLLDPVTELREKVVSTPSTAGSTGYYTMRITQFVKTLGRNVSKVFTYAATSGDTATTISGGFVAMIALERELAITVTGTSTVDITANAGSSDLSVVLSAPLSSTFTAATTFVNVAGSAVTLANATAITQTSSGTVANVGTITATSSNLANGMIVRYTLISGDSFTFRDGTVVSTVGATVDLIVGNVSGTAFDIGGIYDSRLELFTLAATAARTLALVPGPGRGLGSELALRGVVGATAATTYSEVRIVWNEIPATGGTPIQKQHSVFVDTTTSSTNYGTFRFKLINALQGTTSSTTAFQTTATPESASVI